MEDNQKELLEGNNVWTAKCDKEMDQSSDEEAMLSRGPHSFLNSSTPAQVDKHLEFLSISESGNILMGSSNLTGRYWSGSIWYYDDLALPPAVETSRSGMEFHVGVTEGVILTEGTAAIGMDGGILEFISISPKGVMTKELTLDEHLSSVTQVKQCCDPEILLTATTDACIQIFDAQALAVKHRYTPAHSRYLTSVAPHPTHPQLFLSSSLDGTVLLWDTRKRSRPARCVFESDDSPTAVSWTGGDNFLVGCASGVISLCDSGAMSSMHSDGRCTKILHSSSIFRRPVFRFVLNKYRDNSIACCADDTKVVVLTVEHDEIIVTFEEDAHLDYARGLAWATENTFMSCGWDKLVHTYTIG